MDLMGQIKDATATLGGMAQGKRAFDPGEARAAKKALNAHSGQVGAAFREQATDPKSESRADIWLDWDGFEARARTMLLAAKALDTTSREALNESFAPLGASCGGCHKLYRIKK